MERESEIEVVTYSVKGGLTDRDRLRSDGLFETKHRP